MGANSQIEWTWQRVAVASLTPSQLQLASDIGAMLVPPGDFILVPGYTFNPWIGCTKVDELCAHCYAAAQDAFRHWTPEGWGPGKPRRRTSEANWKKVRAWNDLAGALGVRQRVFCASLADWLDDDGVSIELMRDLLALIQATPNLDWLLLTKRPQLWKGRLMAACPAFVDDEHLHSFVAGWIAGFAPANVWVGTSVGHQKSADTRIPQLLEIPARVRFLSCEPMLGPVDLEYPESLFPGGPQRCCSGQDCGCHGLPVDPPLISGMNWVICGGESGSGARPMHPQWARSLRDQCAAAGVPFLFKQWGEWAEATVESDRTITFKHSKDTRCPKNPEWFVFREADRSEIHMLRAGKAAAGRLLDAVEHNGSPEEQHA